MTKKQKSLKDYGNLTYEFPELNGEDKLKELILYISDQCLEDRYFGATKLNKILAFSDFESYRRYGKPITGIKYQSLPEGPAPYRLIPIREAMIKNNELTIRTRETVRGTQQRPVALREANLDIFTAREISIVDQVIKLLWNKTAKQASAESHGIAWKVYDKQALIPYESIHLSDEITEDDIARAHYLIEEHGWDDV